MAADDGYVDRRRDVPGQRQVRQRIHRAKYLRNGSDRVSMKRRWLTELYGACESEHRRGLFGEQPSDLLLTKGRVRYQRLHENIETQLAQR
jgi:hypothetical protein